MNGRWRDVTPTRGAQRQEVLAADADALLNDACDIIATGRPSPLLRAIDADTAVPLMSEQAFLELGWNSATSARGRQVDHQELRALLEDKYLPRIPVVPTSATVTDFWMPAVSEVTDPDDVPHVQLARLVSADVIYSHDRHLRVPGFAPRFRADYDQRLGHLTVLTRRNETEKGAALGLALASKGTGTLVAKTAASLGVPRAALWTAVTLGAVLTATCVLRVQPRRERVLDRMEPLFNALGEAADRHAAATNALASFTMPPSHETARLEVDVASYLVRHPDSPRTTIATDLTLEAHERDRLHSMMSAHPSFTRSSRYGWSIGSIRSGLMTAPPPFAPRHRVAR